VRVAVVLLLVACNQVYDLEGTTARDAFASSVDDDDACRARQA
jgi:hypothetical protein